MTDIIRLGLLMLTWCCQRPEPRYHTMTDAELWAWQRQRQREVNMLAEHVAECKATLAEAVTEYEYQRDQLELIKGILEVRNLNMRDACQTEKT